MDYPEQRRRHLDELETFAKTIPDEQARQSSLAFIALLASQERQNGQTYRDMSPSVPVTYRRDYTLEEGYVGASYEHDVDRMRIHDAVWGSCEIKDEPYDSLLLELASTPLFMRLQAVEQLTFSPDFSTLPNTSRFSRWQHIWGSLVFVRKMTEGDERFSERERIVMQLRTLFSDVGQTSFSHLGDWIFQGLGGGEDLHDQDLRALLEVSGIEEILKRYDLTLDETVFPEVEDWVERPSPDLCVDRVDYGLREVLRWASPPLPLMLYMNNLENPKSLFEITPDGRLAIKDEKFARYFAAGFSLLPSENWSHPTHRVVMELMQSAIRDSLLRKTSYSGIHPRELMYGIDCDFDDYFLKWGGAAVGDIMKQIALEQRRIFTVARKPELEYVYSGIQDDDWEFPEFPDPLHSYTWKTRTFGKYPLPSQLSVEEAPVTSAYMKATKQGLEVGLPRLKARRVNPLVKTKDGYKTLSELEPSYSDYMDEQERLMARSFKATVHMRKDVAKKLSKRNQNTIEKWEKALNRQRDPKFLKKVIGSTAFMLMGTGRRFDYFRMTPAYEKQLEPQRFTGIDLSTDVVMTLDD